MNIYEKINKAKLALQVAGLKKSGKNEFAHYDYFELADFLPTIAKLESELGFCCQISFSAEEATLIVTDTEKPDDQLVFASPMSSASLKGMHDVQNLGAVQTYLRRYLYVNAFEIVEHDTLDTATEYKKPVKQDSRPAQKDTLNKEQLNEFGKLVKMEQKPDEAKARLKRLVTSLGYEKLSEVKQSEYEKLKNQYLECGLPFDLGEEE